MKSECNNMHRERIKKDKAYFPYFTKTGIRHTLGHVSLITPQPSKS